MKRFLCVVLCLMMLGLTGAAFGAEKLNIIAVNFPCYDLARTLAGDTAEVTMLLPPGSESHSYEPTPRDIIAIQNADLFVFVGGESDTWVENILDSMEENAPEIFLLSSSVTLLSEELSQSMEAEADEEEMDEHVWTSPVNMMLIAADFCEKLKTLRPENAGVYDAALESYLTELQALDDTFREIVAGGKRKTIVFGDRFPMRYFAAEYGLEYDAAFPGCSDDSEPSARTVASLIDKIRSEQIPVVFYIEFSSRRTADVLASETGAKALLFHSCHNISAEELENGATYLSLMYQNAAALKEALN